MLTLSSCPNVVHTAYLGAFFRTMIFVRHFLSLQKLRYQSFSANALNFPKISLSVLVTIYHLSCQMCSFRKCSNNPLILFRSLGRGHSSVHSSHQTYGNMGCRSQLAKTKLYSTSLDSRNAQKGGSAKYFILK